MKQKINRIWVTAIALLASPAVFAGVCCVAGAACCLGGMPCCP